MIVRFIVAAATDPDWWDAAILAFVLGGAGAAGKWGIPWAAKRFATFGGLAFHETITKITVKTVVTYEAEQNEKIGHLVDQLQHVAGLLAEDVESGRVLQARVEDLRRAVSELQASGYTVLAQHLEGQQAFQGKLLEVLGAITSMRRGDLPAILSSLTVVETEEEHDGLTEQGDDRREPQAGAQAGDAQAGAVRGDVEG